MHECGLKEENKPAGKLDASGIGSYVLFSSLLLLLPVLKKCWIIFFSKWFLEYKHMLSTVYCYKAFALIWHIVSVQ